MTPNKYGENALSIFDIPLVCTGMAEVNWFLRVEFPLVTQIVSYICVSWTQ